MNLLNRVIVVVVSNIATDARVRKSIEAWVALGFNVELWHIEPSSKGRLWFYVYSALRVTFSRSDVIFHFHDFYTSPLALLGAVKSKRVLFDAHELVWAREAHSLKYRVLFWLQMLVIRWCDITLIVPSYERAIFLRRLCRVKMPYIASNNSANSFEKTIIFAKNKPIRILYIGYLGLDRFLLEWASIIKCYPERFEFHVVGDGVCKNALEDIAAVSSNIFIYPKQSLVGRPEFGKDFDIGLCSYDYATINNRFCAPNKLEDYTRLGLPIILTEQLPLKVWARNEGKGVSVLVNSPSVLALAAVEEFLLNFEGEGLRYVWVPKVGETYTQIVRDFAA